MIKKFIIGLLLLLFGYFVYRVSLAPDVAPEVVQPPVATTFSLTSSAFVESGAIPSEYTCDGKNIAPPLLISVPPSGTKSFALMVDDIDTPQQTWVHWLVWNIPPDTQSIDAGMFTKGAVTGTNSFGNTSYGGPCPPSGRHRYVFRLYALDTYLTTPPTAIKDDIIDAMNTHNIGQTELMGYYQRQ